MFSKKAANMAMVAGLISMVSAVTLSKPVQAEICLFDFLCIRDMDIGGSRGNQPDRQPENRPERPSENQNERSRETDNSNQTNGVTRTRESSTTSEYLRSVRFSVPANQTWVDTDLVVQQGEVISIRAMGRWSNGGDNPQYVSANGYDFYHPDAIDSSIPFAKLIGSVGNGESFAVGQSRTITMTDSGKLSLRMNDVPGTFGDNLGSVRVEIFARYES